MPKNADRCFAPFIYMDACSVQLPLTLALLILLHRLPSLLLSTLRWHGRVAIAIAAVRATT